MKASKCYLELLVVKLGTNAKNDAETATDFSNDAKTSCMPNNTEQFPKFRTNE